MSAYKLPDFLGGHGVTILGEATGFTEPHTLVVISEGGRYDGLKLAVPSDQLVEVTPAEPEPGAYLIGDRIAVRFPVDKTRGNWAVRTDEFSDGYNWLPWSELWQRYGGPGVRIVRLVPETPSEPVESKIWACPEGCGYHIADGPVPDGEPPTWELIQEHMEEHRAQDGPYPYPGDDVAERLQGGGWSMKTGVFTANDRLPVHALLDPPNWCRARQSVWTCNEQAGHGGWHIAATADDRAVAVWPVGGAS